MKQCPNPNCIFYTRLEELPDAYMKCPGCGGMLVNSDTLSGKLPPEPKPKLEVQQYTFPSAISQDTPPHQNRASPDVFASPVEARENPYAENPYAQDPYAYAQDGGGEGEEDPQGSTGEQPQARWSTVSKAIIALSVLLLVGACLIVALLLNNRLFPQGRTITSAQATETAIASLRPPINTPIIAPPTNTLGAVAQPTVAVPPATQTTQAVLPPTQAVLPPTQAAPLPTESPLPPTEPQPPLPTQASLPPTAVQQQATPGPTAPPPQTQASGGVTNAQMSLQLQGGEPAGNVSSYSASDPFNLAVQARFGANAVTSITTRWYGPDGARIYEARKAYTLPGIYYTGFILRKNAPWTPGSYRVDIHTNDSPSPAYSVTFSVAP